MGFKVRNEVVAEKTAMRDAFCQTLIELAKKDDRICLLDADLMGAMGTKPFAKELPERTVDCGIQEANMIGVAAGLSAEGKIPFAHTFGIFATRRACDQIFVSCAYAGRTVKIIGSDPGVTAALNGGTHMPFEDLGIMRGMPEVTVIEPTDVTMLKDLLPKIAAKPGVDYLRLVRKSCEAIYEEGSTFEIGKANVLREGDDVAIIAMGYCVGQALIAAKELEEKGIKATVIDMMSTQDELGRISTYKTEEEFDAWDIWSRKYVLLGMEYFIEISDDELRENIIEKIWRSMRIDSWEGEWD